MEQSAIKGNTKYSFRTNHEKSQASAVRTLQSNHNKQSRPNMYAKGPVFPRYRIVSKPLDIKV